MTDPGESVAENRSGGEPEGRAQHGERHRCVDQSRSREMKRAVDGIQVLAEIVGPEFLERPDVLSDHRRTPSQFTPPISLLILGVNISPTTPVRTHVRATVPKSVGRGNFSN